MTKKEAIRCLYVYSSTNGSGLCTDKQHYEAKQMAIKALEQEPKTGHWIDEGVYADNSNVHAYRCSECKGHVLEYPNEVNEHNPHCKWCGIKMEDVRK